jgi:hypothetical protein
MSVERATASQRRRLGVQWRIPPGRGGHRQPTVAATARAGRRSPKTEARERKALEKAGQLRLSLDPTTIPLKSKDSQQMNVNDFTGSKYLASGDFTETPSNWVITAVGSEIIGRDDPQEKATLQLSDGNGQVEARLLVMNATRLKALARVFGNDMDQWVGKPVRIWVDWTDFRGESVKTIRIAGTPVAAVSGGRTAAAGTGKGRSRTATADVLDDEIPF